MIVLIFALALAIQARLLHFPATSLPDPAAGKSFSLPTQSGNALQELDSAGDFRFERADFGAETKNFPVVSLSAGKAAAAECRFPISFHSTGFKALRAPDRPEMEKQYFTQWRLVRSALFQLDTMEVLVSLLASGACEKYPDFNFVLGELGVTWLPYVFDRLDTEYADRARSLNFKLKPSDYFRRQGYVTDQQDQYLDPIIPLIGEDNIIWGADYPHPDCIWPDSQRVLDKNLAQISPSVRRKITSENVTRLYHLA